MSALDLGSIRRLSHRLLTLSLSGLILILITALPAHAQDNVVAELSIPALNLQAPVLEVPLAYPTWDVSHLAMNVGHLGGTGWVGSGNLVLAGHSVSAQLQPDIFYNLHLLKAGDEIELNLNGTLHRYSVSEVRLVDVSDVSVIQATSNEQLTLLTCDAASYNGSNYQRRYVVVAVPAN